MKPKRIQRKRTKGWRMPDGAIYVGRPTKWGNPYGPATDAYSKCCAVESFKVYLFQKPELTAAVRTELRGKDLACWCGLDEPCHADILLELANAE